MQSKSKAKGKATGSLIPPSPIAIPVCSMQTVSKETLGRRRATRPEQPFLDRAWRLLAGRHAGVTTGAAPSLPELFASEWSVKFETLMRNRLVFGALRYGRLGASDKPDYDRVASIDRRLAAYRATGNQEHLVDAAALLLVEFVEGRHPLRHWGPGDDGEHTREARV